MLLVACFWYLVMTTVLTMVQSRLERRFGRGTAPGATTRSGGITRLFFLRNSEGGAA